MVVDLQDVPDGYKRTEVGVIPKDWTTPQIQNISKLINGRGFKPYEWRTSGLPIIRIQNLNGSQDYNYFDGHYDKKIEVEDGQLLFAWSGSRGTSFGPHYWNGPLGLLNYHTWKVISFDEKVEPSYYFHALKGLTKEIEDSAHGASALVHVQKWEIEARELPLPTRKEQIAIAEALSDADEAIRSLEAVIAKKRDVKQATLHALLTPTRRLPGFSGVWEEKTFEDIFIFGSTATNSRADLDEEATTYYIHYGDIHQKLHGLVNLQARKLSKIDRIKCQNATLLKNSDWVMVDASEDLDGVGKAIEIAGINDNLEVVAGLHTYLLREKTSTFVLGFKAYLGESNFLKSQYQRVLTGMKVYGVSKTALRDLIIKIPPKPEQTAIANILSDMDAEIEALETRLDKLRNIKQGMMQVLLTGKVRLI